MQSEEMLGIGAFSESERPEKQKPYGDFLFSTDELCTQPMGSPSSET